MGIVLTIAAYGAYAVFWIRFFAHLLVWWQAVRRSPAEAAPAAVSRGVAALLVARDVALFWRLLKVNPALWFGEWVFHGSFVMVVLRHLRYFLDPVPLWVWDLQLPGLIAGYLLPLSLLYILAVRAFSERETYSSVANLFLLGLVLAISGFGVMMHAYFKPDLAGVKLFVLGWLSLSPAPLPDSVLLLLHLVLVLVLVLFVPTHIVAAPLVMYEARKRDLGLGSVMHDGDNKL